MRSSDPGTAGERTALAWQRTALSIIAGSVIMARLTFDRLGVLTLPLVGMSVLMGALVLAKSRGRYVHCAAGQQTTRLRGGQASAALAVASAMLGVSELAALLAR